MKSETKVQIPAFMLLHVEKMKVMMLQDIISYHFIIIYDEGSHYVVLLILLPSGIEPSTPVLPYLISSCHLPV